MFLTRLYLTCLLLLMPAIANATDIATDINDVRSDLAVLDAQIYGSATANVPQLTGTRLKARDLYHAYLARASTLTNSLYKVKKEITLNQNSLSLQHLGALTQRLSSENRQFADTFKYGEEAFQSYQLIQKAVLNLEEAVEYWRLANKYRKLYRGSVLEKAEDDEILQVKIQTALTAIEDLKKIEAMRKALDTLEADFYP